MVWGLNLSSYLSAIGSATTIVARILNELGGRFISLRFGGIIGSFRLNLYGIVGSFESESIVIICGPCDAMDDKFVIFWVLLPDIAEELRKIGVLGLRALGLFDDCST